MQTATVTKNPFQAYNDVLQEHDKSARPLAENLEQTIHYIWHLTDPIPYNEIVGGWIQRGQVTPVLPFPKWDRWEDVPEGSRVRERSHDQNAARVMGHPEEAQMLLAPHPIFEDILDKYAGENGVVELTALRDWPRDRVAALDIDNTFFPNGVPSTYSETIKAINEAGARLKDHPDFKILKEIRTDMLRAIELGRLADNHFVDQVESWIEMSKSNPAHQSAYCGRSLRAMARLERTRKDHAVNLTAKAQQDSAALNTEILKTIANNQQSGLTAETLAEALALAIDKIGEVKEKKAPKPATAEVKK